MVTFQTVDEHAKFRQRYWNNMTRSSSTLIQFVLGGDYVCNEIFKARKYS